MSKRKAEVTSLFADYGSDDEEESEHEGSASDKNPGASLLLAYGEDEEDNTSQGVTSPENGRTAPAGSSGDALQATALNHDRPSASGQNGDRMDTGADAPGTSSAVLEGGLDKEGGDAADQEKQQQQQPDAAEERPQLPPELRDPPPGELPPEAKAKVQQILKAQHGMGLLLTRELKASRDYQNPAFLRKMVDHVGIQERGSCFSREVFDPLGLPKEDHVAELKREWQQADARRAKQRAERKAVEFKQGGVQAPPAAAGGLHGASLSTAAAIAQAQAQAKASLLAAAKKTKWDLGGK